MVVFVIKALMGSTAQSSRNTKSLTYHLLEKLCLREGIF